MFNIFSKKYKCKLQWKPGPPYAHQNGSSLKRLAIPTGRGCKVKFPLTSGRHLSGHTQLGELLLATSTRAKCRPPCDPAVPLLREAQFKTAPEAGTARVGGQLVRTQRMGCSRHGPRCGEKRRHRRGRPLGPISQISRSGKSSRHGGALCV